MTHTSRMHSHSHAVLSSSSHQEKWSWGVCVWGVTWPEHRALRFHEIACIREVKKTKCYFLKSCDPALTTSLWRGKTASHRGVNHSLMLLAAAADTSTLLFFFFFRPPLGPSELSRIFLSARTFIHITADPSDVQEVRGHLVVWMGDLSFFKGTLLIVYDGSHIM